MDSKKVLETAIKSIETFIKNKEIYKPDLPKEFDEKRGVFVTIKKNGELRGCIGFVEPEFKLKDAIIKAAISSTRDPRFPPLTEDELKEIKIEVSVLTKPEPMDNDPEKIEIGKDGLIVRRGIYSGLLLPQVATENNMKKQEFLEHTCLKAGMKEDAWKDEETKVFKFQAEIFSEK